MKSVLIGKEILMPIFTDTTSENIYRQLVNQIDKIYRHLHQGSYKTRPRYRAAVLDYCAFVAAEFHLQKFQNTKSKHVTAWVHNMKSRHLGPSTIKTNLSGLRFFLDQVFSSEFIPSNNDLELTERVLQGIDRYWTEEELAEMISIAENLHRYDLVLILKIARHLGLRIHEVIKLERAQIEYALRHYVLIVRGKGGRIRSIPVSTKAAEILQECLAISYRGQKVFVPQGMKAHQVQDQVRNFIFNHRSKVQENNRLDQREQQYMRELGLNGYSTNITYHGIRHSYAREQYLLRRNQGLSPKEARQQVALLLGHGRDQVTMVYTGSKL
jgi:integrase